MRPSPTKRSLHRLLAAVLFTGLTACGANPGGSDKPSTPLSITIEPQGEIVPGEPLDLVVRVDAGVSMHRVEVKVDLGETVLLDGATEWTGAAGPDRDIRLPVAVRLPEGPSRIAASVTYRGKEGTRFSDRALFEFGPKELSGVQRQEDDRGRRTRRLGEDVIEYPAE